MKNTTLLSALAVTGALTLGSSVEAATINFSSAIHANNTINPSADVSVFDGNAFINGNVATTALDNVVDYAFFHDDDAAADFSGPANILSDSVTRTGSGSTRENLNFYTTNDPTSLTPNATFNQLAYDANTVLTGTISFAGLTGGTANDVTVYFIHGGFVPADAVIINDGTNDFTHAVRGSAIDGSARAVITVTAVTFSDFDLTDTFTYTIDGSFNNPAYTGAIVTQVPEPGSLALIGLGGLLIARRRRG